MSIRANRTRKINKSAPRPFWSVTKKGNAAPNRSLSSVWLSSALVLVLTSCNLETVTPQETTPTVTPIATATQPAPSLPPPTATYTPTITPQPTPTSSYRTGFPDSSGYEWTMVASGLNSPVDIQNAGDGSGRLFIVERAGDIRIFQGGQLLPKPFLDIHTEVLSQGVEQGLLGLAFHPDYRSNGEFFVNYIDLNGNTVIARFHISGNDPNQADPTSEVDLMHVNQPYPNHNGGGLAFGTDGFLYIGLGDGGSERDPQRTGQNLQTLLGKMLRIDVNHGTPYSIPPDNPYIGGGGRPEIWASGLRNPWRFTFDRLTGDLYIADVGQDRWEEVDFVPAGMKGGLNFGWSYYEGLHVYNDQPPAGMIFTWPVTEYSHAYGCAVTGGAVYRGSTYPDWQGVYFYGDYCTGTIWGLIRTGENTWQSKEMFSTGAKITTFGTDEAGNIYLADYRSGTLLRFNHP
jgi:glucose/arabinose dehydrogenase